MSIQDIIPKSRLTLRYKTEIHGQPEDIDLPFRLLIAGDLSGKNTKKVAFDARSMLNFNGGNTDATMKKMRINVSVKDSDENIHTLPITEMDSFRPENITQSVEPMREMLKAKNQLNHLLSSMNNSAKFRMALKNLIDNPEAKEALKELLAPSYEKNSVLTKNIPTSES